MSNTPKDQLANELLARLHDPAKYMDRKKIDGKLEPLKEFQLRVIMEYFEDVQVRIVPGDKSVIVARGPFTDIK